MSLFLRKRVLGVVPHALLLLAASCGGSATNDSSGVAGSEAGSATAAQEPRSTSSTSRRRRMRSRSDSAGDDGRNSGREDPSELPPAVVGPLGTIPPDVTVASRCLRWEVADPSGVPSDAGSSSDLSSDAGGSQPANGGSSADEASVDAGVPLSPNGQDAGSNGNEGSGEDDSSSEDDGSSVIAALGLPCEGNCAAEDCYVPGTGQGAICSRQCESHADCGATGVCQALGSYQKWCFLSCQADSDCTSVNPQADNPLVCLPTYHSVDPYLGSSEQGPACHSLCVQSSEP